MVGIQNMWLCASHEECAALRQVSGKGNYVATLDKCSLHVWSAERPEQRVVLHTTKRLTVRSKSLPQPHNSGGLVSWRLFQTLNAGRCAPALACQHQMCRVRAHGTPSCHKTWHSWVKLGSRANVS